MNFLKSFPPKEQLLQHSEQKVFDLNGHIHTPFSFSAFKSIPQIFEMANAENVKSVGINDFIVTDGYKAFHDEAVSKKVFPLFNIEFMGLLKKEQANGIKVNDPNNPGRTYFSGKGLDFPSNPDKDTVGLLKKVKEESNKQTAEMIRNLNDLLQMLEMPFGLTYEEVKALYAEDLVRERHIAKALRRKVFLAYREAGDRSGLLSIIFSGKQVQSSLDDINGLENEIRSNLLKAGGAAFVPENDDAFLEITQVMEVIVKMGGVPCYPVLLDDKNGNFTEFESDFEVLRDTLQSMGIGAVELIPGRNDINVLKKFVQVFHEADFVITFGTEHNTQELIPLKVDTRGHIDLDDELKQISYQGACVLAAHQYLRAQGEDGFIDAQGKCKTEQINDFRLLGAGVFNYFFSN
jgi:hypothetical protein